LTNSPTAYGMVQAITGYADHAMRPESKAATGPDRAFAAEFGGTGERFKREAIASLVSSRCQPSPRPSRLGPDLRVGAQPRWHSATQHRRETR
jgi:hypothetical protein